MGLENMEISLENKIGLENIGIDLEKIRKMFAKVGSMSEFFFFERSANSSGKSQE